MTGPKSFKVNVSWLNDDKVCYADQPDPIINDDDEIVLAIEHSAYVSLLDSYDQLLEEAKRLAEALTWIKIDYENKMVFSDYYNEADEALTRWKEYLKGESDADT